MLKRIFFTLLKQFQDPGFLLALANAFLYLSNSFLSFLIVIIALSCILLLRFYGQNSAQPDNGLLHFFWKMGQKKFLGLEILGYACLIVAFISMTQRYFISFICAFCFGWANLLLARNLNPSLNWSSEALELAIRDVKKDVSLTPLLLVLFNEPVLLICLGYVHAGLATGFETLWVFPLICFIPYLILTKPQMNRAIPQMCFGIVALWFTLVSIHHSQVALSISNILCMIAYIEISLQEHRLFRMRTHR